MSEYRLAGRFEVAGAQAAAAEIRKVSDGFKRLSADGKAALKDIQANDKIAAVFANIGKQSAVAAVEVAKAGKAADVASISFGRLGGVVAGAFIAREALAGITRIIDGLDKLNDAADATGASIDKIAGLERLARLNGQSLDTVTTSLVKLNQAINAAEPDSKAALALKAIGLEADALKKLDPADALLEVAKALGNFADDGDKARIVQVLFGKSLREVAPLLNDLKSQTGGYAVSATQAALEAERFNKNLSALSFTFEEFGRNALAPVVSALNDLFRPDGVEDFQRQLGRALSELTRLQNLGVDQADGRMKQVIGRIAELQIKLNGLKPAEQGARAAETPSLAGRLDAEQAKAEAAKKLGAAREKAADAAKRQAEAEAKLRADIVKDLADQRLLLAITEQGTDVDEARLRIQLARKGLTGPEIDETVRLKAAVDDITAAKKAAAEAEEAELKRKQEIIDFAVKAEQAAAAEVKAVEQQIAAQLQQNETLGLSGVALAELEAARLRDAAAEAVRRAEVLESDPVSQAEAGRVRELAARYLELADAKVAGAVKADDIEKAKDAIKAQADEAKKLEDIFKDVGKSLTDSLFRGFENGKGFLKSFKDSIVNSFKSLVIRFAVEPTIRQATSSAANSLGFGPSGGAGGGSGSFGSPSFFSSLNSSFTSGLGTLSTAFGKVGFTSGQSFLAGVNSAFQGGNGAFVSAGAGSTAFQAGQFAGQIGPYIGAITSAFEGNFQDAAFQAAGAYLGYAVGGPVGGYIGSEIGKFVSGLIGSQGGTAHVGGGAGAQVGTDGSLLTRNLSGGTRNGSFTDSIFGGIRAFGTSKAAVGDALQPVVTQFAAVVSALTKKTATVSSALGADGEDKAQASIRVRIGDVTVLDKFYHEFVSKDIRKAGEALQKLLQGGALAFALQQSGDALVAAAFAGFDVSRVDKKTGKTVIDDRKAKAVDPAAVQAVAQALSTLQANAALLSKTLGFTAEQVVKLSNGGLNLGEKVATILNAANALATPAEQFRVSADALKQQFVGLNVAVPDSAETFRRLIQGIDKTTDGGLKLAEGLAKLVPAFLAVKQAQAQALAATEQRIGELFGAILARREAAVQALRDFSSGFDDVIKTLRDFRGELALIGADAGPAGLAIRRAQFTSAARRARLGDLDAARSLPELGRGLLEVAAEQSATREDFLAELSRVRKATVEAEGTATRQKSIADEQLKQLGLLTDTGKLTLEQAVAQVAETSRIAATAQQQLTELGLIKDEVTDLTTLLAQAIAERAAIVSQTPAEGGADTTNSGNLQATIDSINAGNAAAAASAAARATALADSKAALLRDVKLKQSSIDKLSEATILGLGQGLAGADITAKQFDDGKNAKGKAINLKEAEIAQALGSLLGIDGIALDKVLSAGQLKTVSLLSGFKESDLLKVLPARANGGPAFGMTLVGERGPEIVDFRSPVNVVSNRDSRALMDTSRLEAQIERLTSEVAELKAASVSVARSAGKQVDILRSWDDGGQMNVRVAEQVAAA